MRNNSPSSKLGVTYGCKPSTKIEKHWDSNKKARVFVSITLQDAKKAFEKLHNDDQKEVRIPWAKRGKRDASTIVVTRMELHHAASEETLDVAEEDDD